MRFSFSIFFLLFIASPFISYSQDSINEKKLELYSIRNVIKDILFVNHFESVETPCVYINPNNYDEALEPVGSDNKKIINSNNKFQQVKKPEETFKGVKCMSEYYSRYMRLNMPKTEGQLLKGDIEISYGYPAASILQYLEFNNINSNDTYFNSLKRNKGKFEMYPDIDRYRIKMWFLNGGFDHRDTVYAYIEKVKDVDSSHIIYQLYFDRMSIIKGDHKNLIAIKYNSTSIASELNYYANIAANILKSTTENKERANAVWLETFLNNENCPACLSFYTYVQNMMTGQKLIRPKTNTSTH